MYGAPDCDLRHRAISICGSGICIGHPVQATSTAFVVLAAVLSVLGGLLFGYDTAAISGAVIFAKKEFALTTLPQAVVARMVLVGAAIAALSGKRPGKRTDD